MRFQALNLGPLKSHDLGPRSAPRTPKSPGWTGPKLVVLAWALGPGQGPRPARPRLPGQPQAGQGPNLARFGPFCRPLGGKMPQIWPDQI